MPRPAPKPPAFPDSFPAVSRRRFLLGLVTAGSVLAACGGRAGTARTTGPTSRALLSFTPDEAACLTAFAGAILPDAPGWPSIRETALIERLDEELSFVETALRDDFRNALQVLEWLPPLAGHWSRLTRLDRATQQVVITRLMGSRIELPRAIVNSVRFVVHFIYYAHPATWERTGFDGPFSHLPPQPGEQRAYYAARTGAAL